MANPGMKLSWVRRGGGTGGSAKAGAVYTYKFNSGTGGFDLIGTLADPLPNSKKDDSFGYSAAIGDVTGDGVPDLIVGAYNATVGSAAGAGRVFVYPCPLCSTNYYTLTTGVANDHLGTQVGVGNVNGFADVISTSLSRVAIFSGPISASKQSPTLNFYPNPSLAFTQGLGFDVGDMLGTGSAEILVGNPTVNNSGSCNDQVGAAEIYFPSTTNLLQPTYIFQAPTVATWYGWGVAIVPASSGNPALMLVGEPGRDNGQAYAYVKQP